METIKNRWDYKKFVGIKDLITIAIIDLWVNNTDRKNENYNLLKLSNQYGKQYFVPIDNAFSFGGINLISLFKASDIVDKHNTLITSNLFQSLVQYVPISVREELITNFISLCDNNCKNYIVGIFDEIPEEWLIPDNLSEKMVDYLFDEDRIKKVVDLASNVLLSIKYK